MIGVEEVEKTKEKKGIEIEKRRKYMKRKREKKERKEREEYGKIV